MVTYIYCFWLPDHIDQNILCALFLHIYLNFIHHGNQSRFARSEKTIDAMNRELGHVLHISTRHSGSTHYWNAATLGEYLEFLGSELRAKRMKHGLDASSKALILMDKATVHQSSTFEKLRDRFQRAHNCILLHGASYQYVAIPGGKYKFESYFCLL